ncbi:MAG: hypothetical protein ACREBG_06735 [Pyrinomonadaceae bacterium]
MTNRRTLSFSILAAALLALCLPVVAAAQWDRYPDNGRDRNQNNGRYGRYDERYLRDSIHRLDRLAKDFEKEVDRALDRSRRDGTRREDQINAEARQFRNAVGDLKSRFGNGRDLNRSRNEAQRVLQEGRQLDRIGFGRSYDNRLSSIWSQIRQELNVIADAYGSYGYDNGRNRRDDDYRRRNPSNNDWWRRIPWPN